MGAARALDHGDEAISLHDLRMLIGVEVTAETTTGAVRGTLLSCTSRSAWIVADDVDHVVALPHLRTITRR